MTKKRRAMRVKHITTGETALGRRASKGFLLVQFDRLSHPQSNGWHLYPRHHFTRLKEGKAVSA